MPAGQDSIVTLGKINGVFGVKGWVKIYSYTAEYDAIFSYKPWYLLKDQQWREVVLLSGQRQGKSLLARIKGIEDRDQALLVQGAVIGVRRECLPAPAEDEFYWSDLIGLSVKTLDDQLLGYIDYLFETGANDVMVVKGDRERWLPWVIGDVVKSVDLVAGVVEVNWDPDF